MKIIHIITSLNIGGAEKLMVEVLPRLRDRGHEVELVLFCGTPTLFKERLLGAGIKITDLSESGSVYNPKFIWMLRRYFSEADIIHTHNTAPQYFAALAKVLSSGGAKLVTTEHNTHNRRRDMWWFKPFDRFIYDRYDSIVAISKKAEENLVAYLGGSRRVVTIENGVDIESYNSAEPIDRKELGVAKDITLITKVAGFREQKDQDTVIRSLTHLPENIHAAFVGDGVRCAECERLAEELGVASRVRFLGVRSDVANILKSSDIVAMSSHWEGLSLSSVEGMASGKPMIASDVQGLREVVGGAGMLFEDGNEKSLAECIKQLVESRELYDEVAAKCLARSKEYDISVMVDRYIAEYKRLIAE